jgi:hypothetical protein
MRAHRVFERKPARKPLKQSSALNRRFASHYFQGHRAVLADENAAAGNGIFGCRDLELEFARETASVSRDQQSRNKAAENPAETAYFRSKTVSTV